MSGSREEAEIRANKPGRETSGNQRWDTESNNTATYMTSLRNDHRKEISQRPKGILYTRGDKRPIGKLCIIRVSH